MFCWAGSVPITITFADPYLKKHIIWILYVPSFKKEFKKKSSDSLCLWLDKSQNIMIFSSSYYKVS